MEKGIRLSINKPCNQKWDELEPRTAQKRYCGQCEKSVVDFSQMSDQKLLSYLQNTNAKVCGKLRPDQLKHYSLIENKASFGFSCLRKSVMAFVLLLLSKPTISNAHSVVKPETFIKAQSKGEDQNTQADGITVSGKVMDKYSKEVLPGVSVILKGTGIGVSTDLDGLFTFPKKLEKGDVLIFMFIGMDTQEYKIKDDSSDFLNIELDLSFDLTGEVSIDHVYTGKDNKTGLWHKVASWF